MAKLQPTDPKTWSGRDDSAEGQLAKRIFQTLKIAADFSPENYKNKIALLGFASDEGIRLNQGQLGAKEAPQVIRKMFANLASHTGHDKIVDFGDIKVKENELSKAQNSLAGYIKKCQENKIKTLVLGGGHETAFGHGLGIYQAFPKANIGIINIDAHLDIRQSSLATSGTPFKQLADFCHKENRSFNYLCLGANLAANTKALLETAKNLNTEIIWDWECQLNNFSQIEERLNKFSHSLDYIYLSLDLDCLPAYLMPAVSAPAALGISLEFILKTIELLKKKNKLKAVDFVEYNPKLDPQKIAARSVAYLVWKTVLNWL